MYNNATIIRTKELHLRYKPKRQNSDFKVAIVVSKKTAKLAVDRNRIRRRIYEWIRLNIPKDYKYDIMIAVFAEDLANLPAIQLEKKLKDSFSKVKAPKT